MLTSDSSYLDSIYARAGREPFAKRAPGKVRRSTRRARLAAKHAFLRGL